MNGFIRRFFAALAGATGLLCIASTAHAQDYPAKAIRIIVPFSPGGDTDLTGRLVGDKFAEKLGQPAIVENRPGAGGVIGWTALTQAAPDGYTISLISSGSPGLPVLVKDFPQNWYTGAAPITLAQRGALVLSVNGSVPYKTLGEFIAAAKSSPGKLNIGSPGGTVTLLGELLKRRAGIDLVIVPYKGNAGSQTALLANEVQLTFESVNSGKGFYANGRLRPIAVGSLTRSSFLPDVQAATETLPGFEATFWFGWVAPAGTPRNVVARLHDAIVSIMQLPDVKKRIQDGGTEQVGSTPEEFAKVLESETKLWIDIARQANFKPQ